MAEKLLDGAQVNSCHDKTAGKGVPKAMPGEISNFGTQAQTIHPAPALAECVVLRKWLAQKNIDNADELESLFVALNKLVSAKDESLMIGHSYFMAEDLEVKKKVTEDDLRFIWAYYIIPLVREYEYELNAKEVDEKYSFDAVKKTIR
jgi:hypothetical protein